MDQRHPAVRLLADFDLAQRFRVVAGALVEGESVGQEREAAVADGLGEGRAGHCGEAVAEELGVAFGCVDFGFALFGVVGGQFASLGQTILGDTELLPAVARGELARGVPLIESREDSFGAGLRFGHQGVCVGVFAGDVEGL